MIGLRKKDHRREGASQSRTRLRDQYNNWLHHHRLSAADSLYRVLDKPVASVLTWLVMGVALALPVGLSVALDNLGQVSSEWDSPAQLSLFLHQEVNAERAGQLATELGGRSDVAAARFISREEALEEFRAQSGLADILDSLEDNPLPNLLLVAPAGDRSAADLQRELQAVPEVAEALLDMEWLQRLNSLMTLSRRLVQAVGALLILGVVLILGNTIRLAIENRRDEIVIVKLVGGSNAFVRRPFLYTGLWYGVGGGAFAGFLVTLALWFLQQPVAELAALYGGGFQLQGLGIMGVLNLVVLGGLLGLSGAWLAVARHLTAIEPR